VSGQLCRVTEGLELQRHFTRTPPSSSISTKKIVVVVCYSLVVKFLTPTNLYHPGIWRGDGRYNLVPDLLDFGDDKLEVLLNPN
jgi:hypothetical protein